MILEAVNDFVLSCVGIPQDRVFQGYQNRYALPEEQDFCVISLLDADRVGTNVETYTDGERVMNRLMQYSIDIDFIGTDLETVRKRASALEIALWSGAAYDFFTARGMASISADQIQYVPYVDENSQYSERFRVSLKLSMWETFTLPQETANRLTIKNVNIENVDVHHKIGG